jgi:hypothetical protein
VTGNLINFDADDLPIKRYQFIHEMTHVWQNQNVGPVYMGHALFSQGAEGDAAYNYGYDTGDPAITLPNANYDGGSETERQGFATGEGGQDELNATNDFMDFGPEQQGQIMMQYFVRKVLRGESSPALDPWQKFATYVQTHPQVA